MIGKLPLIIDASDFVKGMSTSEEVSDGGFSPATDAVNPQITPGAIYAPANDTDKSTNLVGEIIASCVEPKEDFNRIAVSTDSTDDGRVYSVDADGDLTLIGAEDTGRNYIQGRIDIIPYKDEVYITTDTHIVRLYDVGGTLDTLNTSWASFTNSVYVPHPALVYEDNAYYGDGNLLLRQTAANSAPATILTLPVDVTIIALGIDPGSGRMLISYIQGFELGGISLTSSHLAKVGFYDGSSNKLSRTVIVEEAITAFPTAGGVQYVAYGRNLGYWNGSGVTFLRRFPNIAYSNTELMYKHHFAAIGSTLYLIDNLQIIAHGPIISGGSRVFWPAFQNNNNSNNLTHIYSLGNDLLAMSYSSAQHWTVSVTSTASTNTMAFVTNWYRFARPIILRSAYVEFTDSISSGTSPATIYFGNRSYHGNTTGFPNQFESLTSSTGGATRETIRPIAIQAGNDSTTGAQPHIGRAFRFRINTDTNNFGIARIIIYYDAYE